MTTSPDEVSASTSSEEAAIQLTRDFGRLVEIVLSNPRTAALIAALLVDALRQEHPGERPYIPAPDKSARNAAIKSQFNGTNLEEVCREHGVSKTTVYRIAGGG